MTEAAANLKLVHRTVRRVLSHPREILLGAQASQLALPACDHCSGVETRMRRSLQLQAEMTQAFGTCVFDVTLDCEDGAPVGGEAEHAALVVEMLQGAAPQARVAVRVHPVGHAAFEQDVATIVGQAGNHMAHLMIPKVESVLDVERAIAAIDACGGPALPIHVLIESPAALHRAHEIAAQPRVQSLSFGLMDFVSAHNGAIDADAMSSTGQFTHPLVRRAKLEIASACHASGKIPSHCVVTEFADLGAIRDAADRARREFGFTRMWSIHPAQIRPILEAMAPDPREIEQATRIIVAAERAGWAPIAVDGRLHDRGSYRYFWQLLERARRTGRVLAPEVLTYFH